MMSKESEFSLDNVTDRAFASIHSISMLLGIFPYYISNGLKLSIWKLLQIIALHSLFTAYTVYIVYNGYLYEVTGDKRMVIIYIVEFFSFTTASFIAIYESIKEIETIENIVNSIKSIEGETTKNGIGWHFEYTWFQKYFLIVLLTATIVCSVIEEKSFKRFLLGIPYFWSHYNYLIILNNFLGVMSIVHSLLVNIRYINDSQSVVKCYEMLVTLCEELNDTWGIPISMIIVATYVVSMCTAYETLLNITEFSCKEFAWMMINVYSIAQLMLSVTKIYKEAKKTNEILYRRLLTKLDDETLAFHLVAKRDIVFTACGFFNFENSLICSMIKTGTTYLVILLQYTQK